MKKLLFLLFLFPVIANAKCFPIEWGGSGTSYTVGTTTSGTWYVWNCFEEGKLIPNGRIIVAGHRPDATCLAAIINPFVSVDEKCSMIPANKAVQYNRLMKSMRTAADKLPK